ncbi:helix-turn-helix domain-containing protein [Paenibacillus sp. YN15]|uniref:helix-turn-helix domain-containing protein n=1 Tax=Paenibacillus sp. YN15 TaxID=1742774 RepID=UPI0015EB3D54|nr:helix-turn-helix domain-containing protein [Paenibacillus sp. YN15]
MYRVLVVDDEEIIVDGLFELLSQVDHLELEVHRAYSSREALAKLGRYKMDIVYSDIRMPGLSGLELQRIIGENWPFCKVIFVSGYNDFEYVQTAMRNGSFDYIVKTEGDGPVLAALDKAVESIAGRMEKERLMEEARKRWLAGLPQLQKDFLLRLLTGERRADPARLKVRFGELDMELDPDRPVYMLAGSIDEWPGSVDKGDRTLLLYAMDNILAEYFQQYVLYFTDCGNGRFGVLLQERKAGETFLAAYAQDTLDAVQSTFKALLKLPVSMIFSPRPVSWETVAAKFRELTAALYSRFGWEKEKLLIDDSLAAPDPGEKPGGPKPYRDAWLQTARQTGLLLERGIKEPFMHVCGGLLQELGSQPDCPRKWLEEIYYTIALQLVHYMNSYDRWPSDGVTADKLLRLHDHESWEEAAGNLLRVADSLFEEQAREQSGRSAEWLHQLHRYVEEHLDGDLSLTRLAQVVYLNPAYLSRIYKQARGIGLSDYVAQVRLAQAQELLKEGSMKIQEIAEALGYESAAYFSRLFKKQTRLTPNEYREHVR